MKVLIVSHTVISRTNNMGKTLLSYFRGFRPEELAQFYIHSMVPTDDSICRNYFCFSDRDALRSLIPVGQQGRVYTAEQIQTEREDSRTAEGVTASVYQFGRRRTGGVYLARNLLWGMSRWKTERLKQWIDAFQPELVFFMSGDYAFLYDIACWIADYAKVPLAVCCVDDHYIQNRNADTLTGRAAHRGFLRTVHRTMARASCIFAICDSMSREYEKLFSIPCHTLHTSAVDRELALDSEAEQFSYLGNLSWGRNEQLLAMGRALKALNLEKPRFLDVYSGERNPALCADLTEENGIRFHGSIPPEQVLRVMEKSMAVIHTESFDPVMRETVRYSVSTKIAESLVYGPCLVAYGPRGIASMDYLEENGAAWCIHSPEELPEGLQKILTDPALRGQILERARKLGRENHSQDRNPEKLRRWLQEIVDREKAETR